MKVSIRMLKRSITLSLVVLLAGCSNTAGTQTSNKPAQSAIPTPAEIKAAAPGPDSELMSVTPSPAARAVVNSGLLIGLRTDKEDRDSTYRTLWIAPDGGEIKLIVQGEKILVPYGHEWWTIETKKYQEKKKSDYSENINSVIIEDLEAHSVTQMLSNEQKVKKYAQSLVGQWQGVEERPKINFIGNKFISISTDYYYNSGGTLRPVLNDVYVTTIGSVNRKYEYIGTEKDLIPSSKDTSSRKRESIVNIIGAEATPYLEKYMKAAITEKEQPLYGNGPQVDNITSEYDWSLMRKKGKWIPQVAKKWFFQNGSTLGSNYVLNEIPVSLPKSFTSHDELTPEWDTIKKAVPAIVDAVSSPAKDILAVFTADSLMIYVNPLEGIKKPVLTIKLNKNESMIMAHWAVGDYVAKWTGDVGKYLN